MPYCGMPYWVGCLKQTTTLSPSNPFKIKLVSTINQDMAGRLSSSTQQNIKASLFELDQLSQSVTLRSLLSQLPRCVSILFDYYQTPGLLSLISSDLTNNLLSASSHDNLKVLLQLIGPQSKIANIIFGGSILSQANLQIQQLPVYLRRILEDMAHKDLDVLSKYQRVFSRGQGVLDFSRMTLNLDVEEWFLWVLVYNTVNSQYTPTQTAPGTDPFYHDLTRNSHFILLRKYLQHFEKEGSASLKKVLFIIKQYSLFEYINSAKLSTSPTPRQQPKQNALYLIYILIFYDRVSLSSRDMLSFFRFNLTHTGSLSFDVFSLSRLWLYFIRPFDSAENSIHRLLALWDSLQSMAQKSKYMQLQNYNPESLLPSPEVNSEYRIIIKSNMSLYFQMLDLVVSNICGMRTLTTKGIIALSAIAVVFAGPYQSSVLAALNEQGRDLLGGKESELARDSLSTTVDRLDRLRNRGQCSQRIRKDEVEYIKKVYGRYCGDIKRLGRYYRIEEQQPNIAKPSSPQTKRSVQLSQITKVPSETAQVENPWEPQIGSHEFVLVFYLALLLSIVLDFLWYARLTTQPRTNLRLLCSIPVTILILLVSVAGYHLIG